MQTPRHRCSPARPAREGARRRPKMPGAPSYPPRPARQQGSGPTLVLQRRADQTDVTGTPGEVHQARPLPPAHQRRWMWPQRSRGPARRSGPLLHGVSLKCPTSGGLDLSVGQLRLVGDGDCATRYGGRRNTCRDFTWCQEDERRGRQKRTFVPAVFAILLYPDASAVTLHDALTCRQARSRDLGLQSRWHEQYVEDGGKLLGRDADAVVGQRACPEPVAGGSGGSGAAAQGRVYYVEESLQVQRLGDVVERAFLP